MLLRLPLANALPLSFNNIELHKGLIPNDREVTIVVFCILAFGYINSSGA